MPMSLLKLEKRLPVDTNLFSQMIDVKNVFTFFIQGTFLRFLTFLFYFADVFSLDALALSVIATATWLGGWVAVCHSRYCRPIKTTKPIRKLFGPSGRSII